MHRPGGSDGVDRLSLMKKINIRMLKDVPLMTSS